MDTASVIALVAVTVAFIANLVTLTVAAFSQLAEDRRTRWTETWKQVTDKRERLRPQFERALRGAFMLEAL